MSSITKNFLTAACIYLVLGVLAQTAAVFDLWLGFNPLAYTATTAIQQILLLGWLTQLGLALVYDRWFWPPAPIPPLKSDTSNPRLATIIFILFNLGLPLVIIGQPGLALWGGPWLGIAAALGGVLQFLAILMFVYQAWHLLRSK